MSDDPRMKAVPSDWAAPLASWGRALVAAGRSRQTIATRTDHVRRAARALGGSPWDVTPTALVDWAGEQDWARETRRSVYASLRGFWRWGVAAGLAASDPTSALPRVRPADPRPRPAPEPIITEALAHADRRSRLILLCAAELGMRRGEIAQVHADDLERDLLGWTLVVHGKGGRLRTLPLTPDQASMLRLACGRGWLLPGRIDGHLSARRVGELAAAAMRGPWTAHTLRHRFATVVHQQTGGDLLSVQRLLGHVSVATTQRYVAVPDAELRAAAGTAAQLGQLG